VERAGVESALAIDDNIHIRVPASTELT